MSPLSMRFLGLLCVGVVSCAHPSRVEFVLCPSEVRQQMDRTDELGARRELLFPLDYEVTVVERRGEDVVPATVLRPQHTMGAPRPTTTTLADPTHVSDYFILDPSSTQTGIAIRHTGEESYRIQWLTDEDLAQARRTSVIHLQSLTSLPLLGAR